MRRRVPKKLKKIEDVEVWENYMGVKVSKLLNQFQNDVHNVTPKSNIFKDIKIFVNGFTKPTAAELKIIMAENGGEFHMYQMASTTHIIATSLAYTKTKNLGNVPIVKPTWITDSLDWKKLLDYKKYILFSNQPKDQPKLEFPVIEKSTISPIKNNCASDNIEQECSKNLDVIDEPEKNSEISKLVKISSEHSINVPAKGQTIKSSGPCKTASDPNFLEEFYNNSRLHLIATLGAEFKQLVVQLREKSNNIFPGKTKLLSQIGNQQNFRKYQSVIMHIDMDCFFVSVGLKNRPDLKGVPVVVTHARNGKITNERSNKEVLMNIERAPDFIKEKLEHIDSRSSMSEIACCSYEARKCGIKNGMFLGTAVKLCPDLKTIPYDFQGYKEVSSLLYQTVASYTLDIEAVSCDEMYVDLTKLLNDTGVSVEKWAQHICAEIKEVTGCPCSTGFGANRLQARLATKKAKPDGWFYLEADNVEEYMSEIKLADLPGVGYATLAKLKTFGLITCGDVQIASLAVLQKELGQKAGETIWEQARGIDKKVLNFNHERKSVSAEVNYGIRFKTMEEFHNFLKSLSQEVANRLADVNRAAKNLTLKLMVRAQDAPVETAKYLGHGLCDNLSKSVTSNAQITDANVIFKEVLALYDKFNVPFSDLRGIGIQLSKLEKIAPVNNFLTTFLKQENNKPVENKISNLEDRKSPELFDDTPKPEIENVKSSTKDEIPQKRKRGRPRKGQEINLNTTKKKKVEQKIVSNKSRPVALQTFLSNEKKKIDQKLTNVNIDMDILSELPEELQNEIIKEYNLSVNNRKIESASNTSKNIVKNSNNEKPDNYFTNLTKDKLKMAIRTWIQEKSPASVDVNMIAKHFKAMALDKKIEDLYVLLNFLHRTFLKLNCHWHQAYYSVLNIIQEAMVGGYGGTLKVPRKFDCCKQNIIKEL